jgi:dipeptidyl aminopeptidase/acylaminoacyl peptidase
MWTDSRRLGFAIAVAVGLAAGAAQAKPRVPSIEQLAAYPRMSSFTISPDGKHLAALEGRGEDRVILVWKSDALDKPPTAIGSSQMKITGVQFIKNDLLAVTMFQRHDTRLDKLTKQFISKLFITDLAGKDWKEPMPQGRAMSRAEEMAQALSNPGVLDTLPADPDHILVVSDERSTSGDVFKVNVRTYRAERIQRSDDKIAGYITDLDGNLRARTRADVDGTGAYIAAEILEPGTGKWAEHFRSYVKARDVVQIVGFAKDPNTAFLLTNVGLDKAVIYEYDIATRTRKEILFKHRFFDATRVLINRFKNAGDIPFGEILGIGFDGPRGGGIDVLWTSPRTQSLEKAVRDALGIRSQKLGVVDPATGQRAEIDYDADATFSFSAATPDLSAVVVAVSGPARPPEFHLLRNGKLMLLSKAYPDIDPASLGSTRLTYYKARDGLDIPAFVTTPDKDLCGAGPWPAVVHPHGGPWARDTLTFDGSMWVPLMASRCFAVLRPQFRGSQGWGRKLWTSGDAEWGQKMQDDKDDGAKWLIDQGVAQQGRIAMFGFSYGGYAAMVAGIRPEGLYKCAIAGAGVSDLTKIRSSMFQNPYTREAQRDTVNGLNPITRANQVQIPMMVFTGDRDRTVTQDHSDLFVGRARGSGQDIQYHLIKDYAHGPAWTREIMAEQLGYIDDYLRNGCGGSGL